MTRRHRPYRIDHHATLVAMRRAAHRRQRGLCYWCGEPMNEVPDDPLSSTADHVRARYAGGMTLPGNVVAAHKACNANRTAAETNRGNPTITAGDDAPRSPFEVLLEVPVCAIPSTDLEDPTT